MHMVKREQSQRVPLSYVLMMHSTEAKGAFLRRAFSSSLWHEKHDSPATWPSVRGHEEQEPSEDPKVS